MKADVYVSLIELGHDNELMMPQVFNVEKYETLLYSVWHTNAFFFANIFIFLTSLNQIVFNDRQNCTEHKQVSQAALWRFSCCCTFFFYFLILSLKRWDEWQRGNSARYNTEKSKSFLFHNLCEFAPCETF